jgi:predicted permease
VYEDLLRRVQAIPGVESTTLLRGLPMNANGVAIVVDTAAGRTGGEVAAVMLNAGPGFFDTLRIPLLFGRVFDARDRADTPRVAVITDRMARERFGVVNAVGRRFRLANDPSSWTEVIGVVRDTGTGDFNDDVLDPISPPYYMSWAQSGALPTTVLARTSGSAAALVAAMQRELRAVDVTLPVITARTMAQAIADAQAVPAAGAALMGSLGGLGLVLASIGLYAVVGFAVARRTREIGVRMALGAEPSAVLRLVLGQGLALVAIGLALGLTLALIGSSVVPAALLPNVSARDPSTFAATAAVLAAVAFVASYLPARRATRIDPLVALRTE